MAVVVVEGMASLRDKANIHLDHQALHMVVAVVDKERKILDNRLERSHQMTGVVHLWEEHMMAVGAANQLDGSILILVELLEC